jgi:uncharacterized protein (DUF302 family)
MSGGLVVVVSSRPFEDTLNALIASVKHRQVEVFGMVDHAANAQGAGLTLGRTTVVTFGGAKAGTPLLQAHQTLGLDLPSRALVYETAEGQVRIAYREPRDILAGDPAVPGGGQTLRARVDRPDLEPDTRQLGPGAGR